MSQLLKVKSQDLRVGDFIGNERVQSVQTHGFGIPGNQLFLITSKRSVLVNKTQVFTIERGV